MIAIDYSAFGKRLRQLRHARHLTQEQLGELVGVSFQYIGMLERGGRSPSVEMLLSLCCALNCSCEALLEDSLPECSPLTLRQCPSILRNTLTNWLLVSEPDESLLPSSAVDLHLLPPLEFTALDENLSFLSA